VSTIDNYNDRIGNLEQTDSKMNCLRQAKKVQVIAALVEGNSIRATVCRTGVAKNTVVKLLAEIGKSCEKYQRENLVNLPSKRFQCDEIWSF
jgi:hypothetical protein